MIEKIYELVEGNYFSSGDFNGTAIYTLATEFNILSTEFKEILRQAISDEILTVCIGGNPHIKAFSQDNIEEMMHAFDKADYPGSICLYPHKKRLSTSKKLDDYIDRPYELELAKGAGHFEFKAFDLSVLEYYRNDPRYMYETDSIGGRICIRNEYFESESMPDQDQILLKTFGFGYDTDENRYVIVFIRYLKGLSPEHQRVWSTREVKLAVTPHRDYYESNILGSWDTNMSVFCAFIEELKIINEMSGIIGKPSLFKNDFQDDMPRNFGFLIRPTMEEFNNFIHLLDKMMSDNINKDFFKNDIELEEETERSDGKIIIKNKGTIQLLDNWIMKYYKADEPELITEMIKTFKNIRKLRQKPAHAIGKDLFDQNLLREQREIMKNAYCAVRTLRLMFASHPDVKKNSPEISERLLNGDISFI